MKKFWLIGVALFTVFLVACTNDSNDTSLSEQDPVSSADTKEQQQEKEYITLYRADADAQYVEAYVSKVLVTDDEAKKVQAIFDEVTGSYEIRLLNYRMEDDGQTLVLNMGEGLTNVQGTAGEFLFIGSLLNSFFENFPKVETIKLEENGSVASLGHMGTLESFTRADAATYIATADTKEEEKVEYVTLYRADADAQYVEAYVSTVKATDDEAKLMEAIFTEVVGDYKISLLDYRLEDNGETLVLNMGNGLENVQGAAGEFLFVGSVLNSFFENFPKVKTITLEQNGATASLGHMGKLEPFTKADAVTYTNAAASAEEAYLTLYRADEDAQYVEAYVSTVKATDDEAKLMETIFTEVVAGTNLSLTDYRLEDNGETLVLNMNGSLEKIQGAAGESMFIGTLLNSFFENFLQVATMKLEVNGQVASFSHMGTINSFSRADAATYKK